jgi:hypothetical protein
MEEKMKITIDYRKDGNAISDFEFQESDEWFAWIMFIHKDDPEAYIPVSTQNAIDRIRLAVARNEIPYKDVEILFEGSPVSFNEYGAISDYPKGFCNVSGDLSAKILTYAMQKRYRRLGGVPKWRK